MHPLLSDKQRLLLYLAVWLAVAAVLATPFVFSGRLTALEAILFCLPVTIVYAFMSLSALYICRAFPIRETAMGKIVAATILSALFTSGVWTLISTGWASVLIKLEGLSAASGLDAQTPFLFSVGTLLFILAVILHYLLMVFESSRLAERQALELEVLAREAEIKSLRAQVQPHFLFNSLNSISALTGQSPEKARAMIITLSDFLRKTLHLGAKEGITLGEELELIDHFLTIEQTRLGARLRVEKHIDSRLTQIVVPALLLQPLVENAINHGIARRVEGGTLRIDVAQKGNLMKVGMNNPFDADAPAKSKSGLGLSIVRERLYKMFGAEARLDIAQTDGIFSVEITIPIHQNK